MKKNWTNSFGDKTEFRFRVRRSTLVMYSYERPRLILRGYHLVNVSVWLELPIPCIPQKLHYAYSCTHDNCRSHDV